jgi:hypothetical protein
VVAKLEEEAGSVDETMGAYRTHGGGKSLTESRKMEKPPKFCRTMDRNLNYRHHRLMQAAPATYFVEWVEEYRSHGEVEFGTKCFRLPLGGRPLNSAISWRRLAKSAVYLHSPLVKRP